MPKTKMTRLVRLGSAKRLTLGGFGPYLEAFVGRQMQPSA
jgi:hypothetical protein